MSKIQKIAKRYSMLLKVAQASKVDRMIQDYPFLVKIVHAALGYGPAYNYYLSRVNPGVVGDATEALEQLKTEQAGKAFLNLKDNLVDLLVKEWHF